MSAAAALVAFSALAAAIAGLVAFGAMAWKSASRATEAEVAAAKALVRRAQLVADLHVVTEELEGARSRYLRYTFELEKELSDASRSGFISGGLHNRLRGLINKASNAGGSSSIEEAPTGVHGGATPETDGDVS
jgi:hypothetical protein